MLRTRPLAALFSLLVIAASSFHVHAAPGDILTSFTINNISGDGRLPTTPQGLEYHDGYLWVVDFGTDRIYRVYPETVYDDDEVTVLFNPGDSDLNLPLPDTDNPPINSDGNPIGSCFDDPIGTPQYCGGGGLTFAENFLWNASPVTDDIIKIDPVDGDNLESENALASLAFPSPTDMTYDGTHFWAVDWQSNTLNKILPEDGTILSSISGPSTLPAYDLNPAVTNARPFGITWDAQAFWVSDQEEQRIYRISRADGSILNFFDSPGSDPKGLAWDGEFLWHTDQATQTIYKIESGVIPFGIVGCIQKNGRAVGGDVLLSQTAVPDQALVTDTDGCFVFPNFTSGTPIQVKVSESGVDEKPIITLNETSPGDTSVTLIVGDTYTDPLYVATDTEDGDISANVVATPDVVNTPALVDTSVPTTMSVAYDVVDSAGNQADTVYRTINVLEVDILAPVITLLGDNPLQVEQVTGTYAEPGYTATDNRDGDLTGSVTVAGVAAIDVNTAGAYLVTYDVSDSTGNVATTQTRTVNVSDTTPPTLTLSGLNPITLERGDTFTDPSANATDIVDGNLDASIVTSGNVSANVSGSYVLTYDVSDLSGNSAPQLTRTVDVVDTTKPVITLLGANPYNQELNQAYSDPGFSAEDLPGESLTVNVTGTVDTSIAGTYTLIYDATDAAGNIADSVSRDVVVADRTPPVITLLGDNPMQLEQGNAYVEPGYTAIDAVDGDLFGSVVVTGAAAVDENTPGNYLITYDVTDAAGNNAIQLTRTVTVSDTTPPVIILSGDANVDHELQTVYTDAGATATDNIDGPLTVTTTGTVDTNTTGIYILTYNATDAAGNAAAPLTRTIDVADRTAPTITLLPDANPIDHEVGTVFVDPGATATDIIDGNITANIGVTGTVDAATIGSYTLTYNVSDAAGNAAATATRTVNVVDTGSPAITLLGDNPVLHELQTPYIDAGATAFDAADGDLGAVVAVGTVDTNLTGIYTLTYDINDSQGNPAPQVTRTVNVADRTPPTITLTDVTPYYHEQGTAFTDPGATASDIIDGAVTVTPTGTVDINTAGTYILSYDAVDAAGNNATTVTREVIVRDTTIPVITLNGANPLNHEVDTVFVDPGATATDNIDGTITSSIGVTGTVDAATIGAYTLTYNVQDSSGNNATTVTRTVNVVDTGAPTITLLGDNPVLHELQTPYTDAGATASDAADGDLGAVIGVGTVDTNIAGSYTLTYDINDSQGNPAPQVIRTVIVADRTPPTITLTDVTPYYHEQGTVFTDPGATATDIIDGAVAVTPSGTVDANTAGSYTLSYDAVDAAGNNATTVTREVIVQDTTIPVITLSGANPLNHEVDTVFVDPGATATDNIDGTITSSIGVTGTVDAATIGTYTLTYNVQDSSGNSATTVTRTVNVVDTGAPTITLLGSNPVLHELQTPYTDAGATASDAADGDLGNVAPTGTVNVNVAGTYTLTYNINDSQGNPAPTVTRDVIVADRTAPVITVTGSNPFQHEQGTVFTDPGATASDNIDGVITGSITYGGSVNDNAAGSYTLTYNVSDAAGNAAPQASRTVNVVDTTIPVISLIGGDPINHEVNTVFVDPGATASDNIDGNISGNINVTGSVNASVIGTYILTYNVQDSSGNAAIAVTRTVNVADTGAPVISITGANPINHEINTAYVDAGATATDAVDDDTTLTAAIVTVNNVNDTVTGTYTVTYDVTDSNGNPAAQKVRTVNVGDYTPPVITLIGSATVNVEQGSSYTDSGATASDNVDGNLNASIVTNGTVDPLTAGTYIISYDVTDAAGNAATQVTRTVIVSDTTKPVITLVGGSPVNHEQGTAYSDQGASATDNIDGNISGSVTISGFVDANVAGAYVLTYNVSDAAGNNADSVTRTVNVVDTIAPVISLIGADPINHEQATAFVDPGATASDSVDGAVTVNTTGTVNTALAGTYTLSYDAADTAGNNATTVTRDVIVSDTTPPTISLVGSAIVNHEQGTAYVDQGATASDTVDGVISGSIVVTGTVNESVAGTYTLSYNVSDAAGNAATTVTRDVVVSDSTIPVITLNGANPLNHEQGTAFSDPGAGATDNIDGDISGSIVVTGSVNANIAGSYTLTYNVADSSGNNATTVNRTVNVADTTPPTITLTGASTINHEQGTPFTDPGSSATDVVDGVVSVTVTGTVDTATAGSYILSYDAVDAAGNNATTVTRTVIVADTVGPVISVTGANPFNHEQGTAFTDPGATVNDVVDGVVAVTIGGATVDNTTLAGNYVITYDAIDAAGNNAAQQTRDVVVADTTAPTITLNGSATVNHEQGSAYTDLGATASDIVDGDLTLSIVEGGTVDINTAGSYILTYDVTDAAGNVATQVTRTVTVADTTVPVIVLSGANPLNLEQGTPYAEPGFAATDNIDGDVAAGVVVTGSVDHTVAATYILSYNVADSSGNNAVTVTRSVIVADTIAPVITLTGATPLNHQQGTVFNDPGATAVDNFDPTVTVNVTGTVNVNTPGSYFLNYDAADAAGNNATTVVREVVVSDTAPPVITVNGADPFAHEQGTAFTDPGATANDIVDGAVTVTVGGATIDNTTIPGAYVITYDAIDAAGNSSPQSTRTVNVADTIAPTITLNDPTTMDHPIGQLFVDPGFTATDIADGDVSGSVNTTTALDINTEGTYTIDYDVTDTAGNAATTQTRTVNVVTPVVVSAEAETATIGGTSSVASTEVGFNGSGYIDLSGASAGEYLEYSITAYAVPYDLTVRYASTDAITVDVLLDGISQGQLALGATGGTGVWQTSTALTVNPVSGTNTLRFNFVGASATNIDDLTLTPQ